MTSTVHAAIAVILVASLGAMLGGCNDGLFSDANTAANSSTAAAVSHKTGPTISGSPAQSVAVGAAYSFRPTVADATAASVTFAISNKPVWATFDTASGALSGSPAAANVGVYRKIVITVHDGVAFTSLVPFSISVTPATAANQPSLALSGSPVTSVMAGTAYSFRPTAVDPTGASLSFAVSNKPAWATFDATTGTLSGRPTEANVGSYAQILITVSDGAASAALAPFSIAVTASTTAVTLSWTPPALNSNNTPLANLAGYHIYYGTSPAMMTTVITVEGAGNTDHVISNLQPGTWYIAVTAFNSDRIESTLSAVLPVTI
jgi:Putative Ig domain